MSCGSKFYLSISVLNKNLQLVEAIQDIPMPSIVRDAYIWWASSWHMQTPLENIEEGCLVKIEFKIVPREAGGDSRAATAAGNTVSVATFPIDFNVIDSGMVNITFFDKQTGDGSTEHSFVETDIMISKRSKNIPMHKFRRIVHTSEPRVIWKSVAFMDRLWSGQRRLSDVDSYLDTSVNSTVSKLEVRDLKKTLDGLGVPSGDYYEKDELKEAVIMSVRRKSVNMSDQERTEFAATLSKQGR